MTSEYYKKYAKFTPEFSKESYQIKKGEKQFIEKLSKVIGQDLELNTVIKKMPASFDIKHANTFARYISDRRKILQTLFTEGKLTPYVILCCGSQYKSLKGNKHKELEWSKYTYIDAKYDFLEKDEKRPTKNKKCVGSKQHKHIQTHALSVNDYYSQKIIPLLKQIATSKETNLTFDEIKQVYDLHYCNMNNKKQSIQNHKNCLLALRRNIRRVVRYRNDHSVPILSHSPDLYEIIFMKQCALN